MMKTGPSLYHKGYKGKQSLEPEKRTFVLQPFD